MLILLVSAISATPTKSCGHGIVNVIQTRTGVQIIKYPEYLGKDVYLTFQCAENRQTVEKLIPAGTLMIEVAEEEVSGHLCLDVWTFSVGSQSFRLD